jgi:hypothetical protein
MGAAYWDHFVPWQENVSKAFDELARRENEEASSDYPALPEMPDFADAESLGDMEESDWMQAMMERSEDPRMVLGLMHVSDSRGLMGVGPITDAEMIALFGTTKPERQQVEDTSGELAEMLGRGEGLYIVVYKNDHPSEIYFAGYAVD